MNPKNILKQQNNSHILAENLTILIKETGVSRRKVSELANLSPSTLDAIINLHSNPKLDNLINLARIFNINVSQLIGELPLKFSVITVPILSWNNINIDSGKVDFDLNKNTLHIPYYPSPQHSTSNNRLFALPVDSSISARYKENSSIIIEETSKFTNNDLLLLSINKAPPVIKKIIEDDNTLFLKSITSNMTLQLFDNSNTQIFGIIRETRIAS